MQQSLTENTLLSQFLNHDCAELMRALTPAVGIICYEVDDAINPVDFSLHGIQQNFHREYTRQFQQIDPLHPRHFCNSDRHVLSIHELYQQGLQNCRFYTDHLHPYGYEEIIDLHFRKEGKIIAGMTLFFNEPHSHYYRLQAQQLVVLHQFIERSLSKLSKADQSQKFSQFCDHYQLTRKERRIFDLVLKGMANKVIANTLFCSLATVKTHLQNIFNKLTVNSKAEAVTLFLETLR